MERIKVKPAREPAKQPAKSPRHLIQCAAGGVSHQRVSFRREEEKRNKQTRYASNRDLENAIKCRSDRACVGHFGNQQDNYCALAITVAAALGLAVLWARRLIRVRRSRRDPGA